MLAEQSEEELDISDKFVLDNDFDSESDGECPPFLIGKDHANDSDSDDSEDELVNEEDFDPYSYSTKSSFQTLESSTKVYVPLKSVFIKRDKKMRGSLLDKPRHLRMHVVYRYFY